jgi:hypothetical protein
MSAPVIPYCGRPSWPGEGVDELDYRDDFLRERPTPNSALRNHLCATEGSRLPHCGAAGRA